MKKFLRIIQGILIRILPSGKSFFHLEDRETVWIVHPRDINDLKRNIGFIGYFPAVIRNLIILLIPPYIVSKFDDVPNGLKGYVVALPLLPVTFKNHPLVSAHRTLQAIRLAEKLRARKVSIGGFLPSIVERAKLDQKTKLPIFDGTDLLANMAAEKIRRTCEMTYSKEHPCSIGIIGATTKVGSKISKLLTIENNVILRLFTKTARNIDSLKRDCLLLRNDAQISSHTNLESVGECDILVLTAYILDDATIVKNLPKNSTFISVIEPVSPFVNTIQESRPDVNLIKGLQIKTPTISYNGLDIGLPAGNTYACLAEALISDNNDGEGGVSLGLSNQRLARYNFKVE